MDRWFRHYPGLARDEKLVTVALRAGQPIERVVWVWNAILEDAANRNAGGAFALDPEECGWFLRCPAVDITTILLALEDLGRTACGMVAAWPRRQFASDRSAARTAAWRARRAASDVTVTAMQRHGDGPESDTETETETENVNGHVTSHANGTAKEDELRPQHLIKHWNILAERLGKPLVRDLTDSRRQLLKARITQYSVDDFIAVLAKIERSAFLRGDTGWHGCTFDWVMKRANFQKVIEGNYDH